MTVAICRVRKLEWDRDSTRGLKEARSILKQSLHSLLADRRREKVEEHSPLVVPGQRPTCLGTEIGLRDAVFAQPVNETVMCLEHGDVHLRDQQVDILAWVADKRDAFLVSRQVVREALVVQSKQHLGRVFPAKEIGVADRTVAVHAL